MKLFIVPSWYPSPLHPEGGTFFRDQARLLARSGFEVTLIASNVRSLKDWPFRKQLDNPPGSEQLAGVREYRRESINPAPGLPRLFYRAYRQRLQMLFWQALREQGAPDWVWIHSSLWGGAALAPLLAELRIPFLIEEHLKEFLFPEHFSPFQSRLIQKTYQRATRIAGPSRSVVAAILSRFSLPGGQALVLPNPVDSTMFTLPAKSRTPNTFTWISVGLFRKEKRFDLLIKAFADLVNAVDRPQRLILVGDGPERRRMESLISSLGLQREITLTGYQSPTQVAASFRTAQAAVWAGDLETFGVAPVEALSSGLPVVITNCGGPADYVNETNGILTPPGDGPALTQAMARLQEGISQFDRNNIRQSILAYCGEEAFLSQVREVGKMLLNRG